MNATTSFASLQHVMYFFMSKHAISWLRGSTLELIGSWPKINMAERLNVMYSALWAFWRINGIASVEKMNGWLP